MCFIWHSLAMTITTYITLITLLKSPFHFGYSAFTFPLAISATATYKMSQWLANTNIVSLKSGYHFFYITGLLEATLASLMILYVLQHFVWFLLKQTIPQPKALY